MDYLHWYLIDFLFCFVMLATLDDSTEEYKRETDYDERLLIYFVVSLVPIFNLLLIAKIIVKDIFQIKKK